MKKDDIRKLFENLEGSFDTETPKAGHRQRFLERLDAVGPATDTAYTGTKNPFWWKPLAVAASIALLCAVAVGLYNAETSLDGRVAEISPEVSRTQSYFAGLVEQQIEELENKSSPDTRRIVDDTMVQIDKLGSDYAKLERDLIEGGNSKLLLSAMITNFRTRIDLLQEVLDKIESIKTIKNSDEKKTTI